MTHQFNKLSELKYNANNYYLPFFVAAARIGLIILLIPIVANAFNEYLFFGYSFEFYVLFSLRFLLLTLTLFTIFYLSRVKTYSQYERLITAWLAVAVPLLVIASLTRPVGFIQIQTILVSVYTLIFLLVIPNRLLYQIIGSLVIAISQAVVVIVNASSITISISVTAVLGLLLALAIGIVGSWQLHKYRLSNFQEIVNREQVEKSLREREQLYRTLFENTEDGFQLLKVIYDSSGKVINFLSLDVNQAYERQTGLKASDVIGRLVTEYLRNVDPFWVSFYAKVAKTGRAEHVEKQGVNTNRWYDVYAFLYSTDQVGVLFRDITERKKKEEELKLNAERVMMAQQVAHVGTFEWEIQTGVNRWTPQLEALYGLPPGGFPGNEEAWEQLVYYEDRAKIIALVNQAMETGGFEGEWRVVWPDESIHWLLGRAWVFKDPSGKPQRLIGINIDITERKNFETQLKEKDRLAAIGATAGMVGHDIRNPLQSITGELYLLDDNLTPLPDSNQKSEMKESIDSITANIFYINKIVADLQDYARPVSPEYSVVDLSNVLVKIFENVRVPESVKLSIKVKDLEKLPTDPMLLQRALSNLVTNAIQAMPEGGVLEITGHPEENKTVITVSDTGVGIPEEIKSKLFTPMLTTKAKGQGFGLAVSRRLIEAMKGTITFESEKGKGTKFIIELPLDK